MLYTALDMPLPGKPVSDGAPQILDQQPHLEVANVLPRAEGTFQGRTAELRMLGKLLTGNERPGVVTIHGAEGQGKSALAREIAERFGWAWSGGVLALSLEHLTTCDQVLLELARLLQVDPRDLPVPEALEQAVLERLAWHRRLLVLDKAETLLNAAAAENAEACALVELVRVRLCKPPTTLLLTSRDITGWPDEESIRLDGLDQEIGACLFADSAPTQRDSIDMALARTLSARVGGHPLSLRLLGGAFDGNGLPLATFLANHEQLLLEVENKYLGLDHHQRNLYTSIETCLHFLPEELRTLFSGLWVFQDPFLPETAVAIFDPDHDLEQEQPSPVLGHLHELWQRNLLVRLVTNHAEDTLLRYRVLPTVRSFIEHYLALPQEREVLQARFAQACFELVEQICERLDFNNPLVAVELQGRKDLERGYRLIDARHRGEYALYWSWILCRLGDTRRALVEAKAALEALQGGTQTLILSAMNNLALVYQATGQLEQARQLFEQALPIVREVGDRRVEAATLNNLAGMYVRMGQVEQAKQLFEQALPIVREVGDRRGEAATLSNLAEIYVRTGQVEQVKQLYEQALLIRREIGDRRGEVGALLNLASLYEEAGQVEQAKQFYQQTLSIAREIGDRVGESITLNNLGLLYANIGQVERPRQLYRQALLIAREVGDRKGEATTLNNQALLYVNMGQEEQARQLYEQAIPILREINDRESEVATLTNLARVYVNKRQMERARQIYEQALTIRREVGDRRGESVTLLGLAEMYAHMGQDGQAKQIYEQVLPILREVGDRRGEAVTLNTLARMYVNIGQIKRAKQLFEQALPILRQIDDRRDEAATLNNLALLYVDTGQTKRTRHLLEQALLIAREIGDQRGEAITLNNLARLLMELKRFPEALGILKQSVDLCQQTHNPASEIVGLIGIAVLLHHHLGRTSEALVHLNQALARFAATGLLQDEAGHTPKLVRQLRMMFQGG